MPGRVLSLNVVGVAHPNADGGNRRSEIMFCDPGEPIELRPEPKNPKDPYAVAVFSQRGHQIGYLTAERAPWIGSMIRAGSEMACVFQEEAPWGAVVRLALGGAVPTLPIKTDAVGEDDPELEDGGHSEAFYPDYIPPDD